MPKSTTKYAKGSGSIRQRENGTWEARCTIAGKRVSFYAAKQSEALKKMRAAQKADDEGSYFEPSHLYVGQWLDVWLVEYVEPACKPLTRDTYESRIETHIKPKLGKIRLSMLTPTHIQLFYNDLLKKNKLSPKTIKNIHGVLNKALNQAVKLRYITVNPADACTLPRMEKKEVKPLKEQEIKAFLNAIQTDPLRDLFAVTLFTGMRRGEVCGLSWDAVDLEKGTITIKQQLTKGKKAGDEHYIAATKNDKARTLVVPEFVLDILKNLKKYQEERKADPFAEWNNEYNLVFTNPQGHFIYPQTARKRFQAICKTIGRPDAKFHDLRHTYAVTALQEGDNVKTVQQALGHATASFTLDVYGHVSEKMKNESAARMQSYFEKMKE